MTLIPKTPFTVIAKVRIQDQVKSLAQTTFHDDEDLTLSWTIHDRLGGVELTLTLVPKTKLTMDVLDLMFKYPLSSTPRVFVNGYQTWTDSRERDIDDRLPKLSWFAKLFNTHYWFTKYGDLEFIDYPSKKGLFHGWTYAYLRNNETIQLMGSLDERSGFTIFELQAYHDRLIIHKDVAGITLDKPLTMRLFFIEATDDKAFDAYFTAMGIAKPKAKPAMGWTSWYNYYPNINEKIIQANLDAIQTLVHPLNIIQIDDGYQTAVGDWLSVDPVKFPNGMKVIADKIKALGATPGIWLAPFVAQKSSDLVKNHPDWILKDAKGKPEMAGYGWGGNVVLDSENPEVREYLRHCFDVVLNTWGFGLVKLDFLYAAALGSHPTKTRGQRSAEAIDFLREIVGDKLILGCGVPLGSAFGKFEYCRIGPDVSLDWDGPWYYQLIHRERISTKNAILNTIGRRHLDGRAFQNDPDVFLLRSDNIKLTSAQKEVLAKVNAFFGSLLFTSDLISTYDAQQLASFKETIALTPKTILRVSYPQKDAIEVFYRENKQDRHAYINLNSKPYRFPDGQLIDATSIFVR